MNEITAEQMAQLRQRAEAGDARGQYLLAGVLSQQDQSEEAGAWLQKAADLNYPDALYTLGSRFLEGPREGQDWDRGFAMFSQAYAGGLKWLAPTLGVFHALGIGTDASWAAGLKIVGDSAGEGQITSLVQIAMLTAMREPDHPAIETMLSYSAQRGEPFAMFALASRKLAGGNEEDEAEAWHWMREAAAKNHPLAHLMVGRSGPAGATSVTPPALALEAITSLDWKGLLDGLQEPPLPSGPDSISISDDPKIARHPAVLTQAECGHLAFQAIPHLSSSGTIHPVTGEVVESPIRTSAHATFWPINQDLVIHAINCRVAQISGLPWTHQEMLCVLFYAPGQEYKPHHDFLVPDKDGRNEQLEKSGQRVGTFMIYLNEDYAGGETEFLNLDLKFRGAQGEGLYFENMLADGSGDERTLHTGLPVTSGNKWLASKWIREKPFVY